MGLKLLLGVGLAGAIGVWLRWGLSRAAAGTEATQFPVATLVANVLGCFLIGVLATRAEGSVFIKLVLLTGFLGGLTTFSAYALELVQMLRAGQTTLFVLYFFVSNLAGLASVLLGYELGRAI